MSSFFRQSVKNTFACIGFLIAANTLFFIGKQLPSLAFLHANIFPNTVYYFLYLFLGVLLMIALLFHPLLAKCSLLEKARLLNKTLFPSFLVLFLGVMFSTNFHFIFQLGSGLGLIAAGAFFFWDTTQNKSSLSAFPPKETLGEWVRGQGTKNLLLVLFLVGIFFSFGFHNLGKYAAVDEPLWLYGRIGQYWNNLADHEWHKTDVSDKPGITVSILSGAGLLTFTPNDYDDKRKAGEVSVLKSPGEMEQFFFAFRLPLLLALTLLLPLLYFLLERLLGKNGALLPFALIATSPLLIGVAKIINPDALLWLFTTLSLISFLVFQKRPWYRYLVLSGFFLGLALLTKYIANIVYIYLLSLLFLEYLYHPKQALESFPNYLKKTLLDIGLVIFVSLSTFYILLPANWVDPMELIESTLLSQAFVKVAPLFIIIIGAILLDQQLNRARITTRALSLATTYKTALARSLAGIFFASLFFVLINTWSKMPFLNFMELIASPKTIGDSIGIVGIFLTNFYPLAFGMTPIALLGLALVAYFLLTKNISKSPSLRLALYVLIFTLIYYLGATVNGVASIIRYQIIVFPLVALAAGVGLFHLSLILDTRFKWSRGKSAYLGSFLIGVISLITLSQTPFPLSYASALLPSQYYIDLKDMGPGSYEIAQMLNTLPDAENILIWTDKDGVCQFFVGRCKRGDNREVISDKSIDYIVVSSAREVRTGNMIRSDYEENPDSVIPIHLYYNIPEQAAFTVLINGRPNHFVKAFRFENKIPEVTP